jgi:hypothetical protein
MLSTSNILADPIHTSLQLDLLNPEKPLPLAKHIAIKRPTSVIRRKRLGVTFPGPSLRVHLSHFSQFLPSLLTAVPEYYLNQFFSVTDACRRVLANFGNKKKTV